MIRFSQNIKRFILVIGDLLVFSISLLLTFMVRYGEIRQETIDQHTWPFLIIFFIWVAGFYAAGLYNLTLLRNPLRLFRTYTEGMIANLLVALAFFYLIPFFGISPRTNLLLDFAITLLLGYAWRLSFLHFIDKNITTGRVLFIGPVEEIPSVHHLIQSSSLGMKLTTAFLTEAPQGFTTPHLDLEYIQKIEDIPQIIKQYNISTIVLGTHPEQIPNLNQVLYQTIFTSVSLIDRAEIEEITTGRIPLSYVTQTWFLQHLREGEKTWYEAVKRVTDILMAIPLGFFTLLFLPLFAALIKFSSPGPVFYGQMRVGRHGKPFKIWKLRTMRTDAEKYGPQFTSSTKTDPRITRIGKLFRQLRIDELPQIWNVVRGDLSFIGPRPERPEFVEPLAERMPYYQLRHLTRPGLTGWAQVLFLTPTASLEDNLTKLQYDLYYIKHRSLLLDLAIALKTIGIILRRQGT